MTGVFTLSASKFYLNSCRGVTLVEVMIVVILIGFAGAMGMQFFTSASKVQKEFSQKSILQMESRKAFDHLVDQIREGIDVIRPVSGETTQFLVFKDLLNQITLIYLEPDDAESRKLKQRVYRMISYRTDYSGSYDRSREKVLHNSVKRLRFTSLSPTSVQVSATVAGNDGDEYQFLAHVGLLNTGGI
jgi:prepilin-type N-terminal cleavage/methylation domain-containing protein